MRPRERDQLREIERFTHCKIEQMSAPTAEEIGRSRTELFKAAIRNQMQSDDLEFFRGLIRKMTEEGDDILDAAAGLARLAQLHRPLQLPPDPVPIASGKIVLLQLSAGRIHGVRVNDVVGALANEAGIPGPMIGAITICDRDSFVEIPQNFVDQALQELATLRGYPIRCRIAPQNIQPRGSRGQSRPRPFTSKRQDRTERNEPIEPIPQPAPQQSAPCEIERFESPRKPKDRSGKPQAQARQSEFHPKQTRQDPRAANGTQSTKAQKRERLNRRISPRS